MLAPRTTDGKARKRAILPCTKIVHTLRLRQEVFLFATITIMAYQAIIFDLDGTAIPNEPNAVPSEELLLAIHEAQPKIKLCAATGRPITNAKPILDRLNLESPCVISAGTQIVDPKTNELLWEAALSKSSVEAILTVCQPYHYEILLRNELIGEGKPASERIAEAPTNVLYIMGCAEADAELILEKLSQIPNITAAGVTSWTQDGIDIHVTHENATKEHAIRKLLEILGIAKENTIGVGDANNDVHLFRAVGLKVAMGNATPLLKSQADEICDSVDDNGLAKLIRKYTR